jgi:hypothetical protein
VTKVLSIYGGPVGEHEVNETCVAELEEWLEMAKSGQIVGICLVGLGMTTSLNTQLRARSAVMDW